jgi:hypothetical protein
MAKDLKVKVTLVTDVDNAVTSVKKAEGSFRKFGKYLSSRFVFTLADVERAFRKVFDAMRETITLKRQEIALRGQLASMGVSFDTFIAKLKETSNNTVTTAKLIEQSSRALLLGIPVDEIGNLLSVASSRAATFGRTVEQAFDDLVRGIGRASPKILDNLGFVVDLEDIYLTAAETLGKTVEQLTRLERQTALTSKVLRDGRDAMDALGDSADDMGTSVDQAATALSEFNSAVDQGLGIVGTTLAAMLTQLGSGLAFIGSAIAGVTGALLSLAAFIPGVGDLFTDFADKAFETAGKMYELGQAGQQLSTDLTSTNSILIRSFLGLEVATDKVSDSTKKLLIKQREEKIALEAEKTAARELTKALKETADAEDALAISVAATAEALGLATSLEIQKKIDDINTLIRTQADELGETSQEYKRMRAVGEAELTKLNAQLVAVQAGLSGVKDAAALAADGLSGTALRAQQLIDKNRGVASSTDDLTSAFTKEGQALHNVDGSFDEYRDGVDAASESNKRFGVQTNITDQAVRRQKQGLEETRNQVRLTILDFDRLVESQGRVAAGAAAIAAGARQSGNRVFIGGVGRFITEAGFGGITGQGKHTPFNISGGTFTTVRR